jgi:hypothetical protein
MAMQCIGKDVQRRLGSSITIEPVDEGGPDSRAPLRIRFINMTIIRRKSLTLQSLWIFGGAIFLALFLYYSNLFLIPLFLLFILTGVGMLSLTCQYCGKPIHNNPVRFFGWEIYMWTPWVPKKCSKCEGRL